MSRMMLLTRIASPHLAAAAVDKELAAVLRGRELPRVDGVAVGDLHRLAVDQTQLGVVEGPVLWGDIGPVVEADDRIEPERLEPGASASQAFSRTSVGALDGAARVVRIDADQVVIVARRGDAEGGVLARVAVLVG